MENLTEKIDALFARNRGKEAEELLKQALEETLQQGRLEEAVPVLNELIGYCRETSQVEKSYEYAGLVLAILDRLGLEGTLPYATTLLNIANAYRAGGRLEDSLAAYGQVQAIYQGKLKADDMLFASLYNNMSLLYQEMNRFDLAKEALLKALAIVMTKEDAAFEVAVTCANLAATSLSLGQDQEAERYFTRAIGLFEENEIYDTHYCAALSSMGTFLYKKGQYREAEGYFRKAMEGIERHLGQNEYYHRMQENAEVCRQAAEAGERKAAPPMKGLDICRAYYETYGRPMLETQFPEYLDRIAVGLVGEGSDCFGFDDEISRDHDWGPSFCMWVTEETYLAIGGRLQQAYESLPAEFMGYRFQATPQGKMRRGVHTISYFYQRLLGGENIRLEDASTDVKVKWEFIGEEALAAAVNGEVFADPEGIFTRIREMLKNGYPRRLRYLQIAQHSAAFCQNGQYNVPRLQKRQDEAGAVLLVGEGVKEALKLLYQIAGSYAPHDKWLFEGLKRLPDYGEKYEEIAELLRQALLDGAQGIRMGSTPELLEKAAEKLAHLLYQESFISDTERYLDVHVEELLYKARIADLSVEELAEKTARIEFEAFDQVKNLGGRADCQDDWSTFSIMRKSQYLTWNRDMLLQYLYDFSGAFDAGHNLVEEKYGRMMESTAPGEYAAIREHFPVIDAQKKAIIESIVGIQVGWMEEFAHSFPCLAGNARSIHTYEDTPWNTSYETYLRGEISTYSDKMLELYGRYIVEHIRQGKNLAREIMEQSVLMYGYEGLEEAEEGLRRQG